MRLVANWHDPFTFFLPSSSLQFFDAVSWATLIIFAYWLTRVVPEKGPLDGCVCVPSSSNSNSKILCRGEFCVQKVMEEFSSGQADDVDSFISRYIELRTLVHTRRIKVEKLSAQVREPQRRDYAGMTAAAAPVVPARRSPIPPYAAPMSSYPHPHAVPGTTPGFTQMAPYPPIGAANGWAAQYPNGPMPVPFTQQ